MPTIDEQVEVLMSNTGYGDPQTGAMMRRELRERLLLCEKEERPLRVYCGYDPTTADLHLGHTITMRKLKQFQDFGHQVTFLIGSFTSRIGDPDHDKARDLLSEEQVRMNGETYAEQAFKILDRSKTTVRHNSEWLAGLNFLDIIKLAQAFTVQQFITRENFRNRIDAGTPIYLHEFFYPLMQGYDAGRQLMQKWGMPPQIVVVMGELLPGTDGVLKMSKSKGNHIPILTDALDMFGKVMSIPDIAMPIYHKLLLGWTEDELKNLGDQHPRDVKANLARQIVAIFHPDSDPEAIQREWEGIHKQGGTPDDIADFAVSDGQLLIDILAAAGLVDSKAEAKRQMENGGVRLEGEKISDRMATISAAVLPAVLQVGKRKFVRLVAG
jgi:tyrosyl-tRNA synthetase